MKDRFETPNASPIRLASEMIEDDASPKIAFEAVIASDRLEAAVTPL